MQPVRSLIGRALALLLLLLTVLPAGAGAAARQAGSDLEPAWLEDSLNGYWEDIFDDLGLEYEAPDVVVYDDDIETDCGDVEDVADTGGDVPFYCPADATVYVADGAYDVFEDDDQEVYWVELIARLWGVHVLWLVEYPDLDDEEEPYYSEDRPLPEVSCFAGAYLGQAVDDDDLSSRDVEDFIEEEEADDVAAGYDDGIDGCGIELDDVGSGGGGGGGEDGEVYESPSYGYTITYDAETWDLYDEEVDDSGPYDRACFTNDTSVLCVTGDPDYDEDQMTDCLDDYVAGLEGGDGVSDVEPLDEPDAEGDEDGRAWATYTYTVEEDGDEGDFVRYYECIFIDDGLTIVILHGTFPEDYEDEIEVREEFVAGIDTGDGPSADEEDEEVEEDEPVEEDEEEAEDEEEDSSAKRSS